MRNFHSVWTLGLALTLAVLVGCNKPADSTAPADDHDHDHEHGHADHGPHEGSLIELGEEEYHAELVHDEATGEVTIWLLDGAAKEPVAIEAGEIMINASHDGQPQQFALAASPAPGEEGGISSRFVSSDAALAEALDAEGAEPVLVVTIGDTPYRGEIHHDHDHEGHDHDH